MGTLNARIYIMKFALQELGCDWDAPFSSIFRQSQMRIAQFTQPFIPKALLYGSRAGSADNPNPTSGI